MGTAKALSAFRKTSERPLDRLDIGNRTSDRSRLQRVPSGVMQRVPSTSALPHISAEDELTRLQAMMDQKIKDMDTEKASADVNQHNPHVMDSVMEELEQRNLEMASLLKASDKSRQDMEELIKENNKEITSLRANTLVMYTLEDNVASLQEKEAGLRGQLAKLQDEIAVSKIRDKDLHNQVKDTIKKEEVRSSEFNEKILDLTKNLLYAEDQIAERDGVIEKTEKTLKDLFDTCEQIGDTNNSIRTELHNCRTSNEGLHAKNQSLQYCKEYLEEQVDSMVKDVKAMRGVNEKLKLEIANMAANNRNHTKTHALLNEKVHSNKEDIVMLKDQVKEAKNVLNEYESGDLKSNVVLNEIKKERLQNDTVIKTLQTRIENLDKELEETEEKVKKSGVMERRVDSRMSEMETKINNYQENYIEHHELETLKKDLQVRHKLDLNLQRTRVGAVLNRDQLDLIKAIKDSLAQKKDAREMDDILTNFLA